MKTALEKYGWHIVALIVASGVGFVVVFGFGEALGIDPAFRDQLMNWLGLAWASFVTSVIPLVVKAAKKDTDGDGTPDFLDDDANGNGKADGTTTPPPAPTPGVDQ